jgi:membrane-associated phospholipid phosphatase
MYQFVRKNLFFNIIQVFTALGLIYYFVQKLIQHQYPLCLCIFILIISVLTLKDEKIGKETPLEFLKVCISIVVIFQIIKIARHYWWEIVKLETLNPFRVNLNNIFKHIPLNNPDTYIINNPVSSLICKSVYTWGFIMPVFILILRNLVKYDYKRAIKVLLEGQIGQIIFVVPFYFVFHVQEVWYVMGFRDYLHRAVYGRQRFLMTLNCFPSMHTSIAFAMILSALKEKNKLFKVIFIGYNIAIIYSTLYLRIHWTLDVIAGMIFATVSVISMDKLVDFVCSKLPQKKSSAPEFMS